MGVVIAGTLGTKGEEIGFTRDVLGEQGVGVHLVDVGVLGKPEIEPNTDATVVARADGSTLEAFRETDDRGKAIEITGDGVAAVVSQLHGEGRSDSILRLGDGRNMSIMMAVIRALPMSVPRLMLPTMALSDTEPYVGYHDIAMIYSVVDIEGLNQLLRTAISNVAFAMVGMASNESGVETEEKPTIGIMMFGVTTPYVQRTRNWLEARGYETIVSHATGTSGRATESLIEGSVIDGVLDVMATKRADELIDGVLATESGRLDVAVERGIPQVILTDAFDMVSFGPKDSILDELDGRQFYAHNLQVTLMRTMPEENAEPGHITMERLNAATGPTIPALPLDGVSMLDAKDEASHDPETNDTLFDALRKHLNDDAELVQSPADINGDEFVLALAEAIDRRMRAAA